MQNEPEIRYYTKQEIALLYFPDSSPEVANAHLRRWQNMAISVRMHQEV